MSNMLNARQVAIEMARRQQVQQQLGNFHGGAISYAVTNDMIPQHQHDMAAIQRAYEMLPARQSSMPSSRISPAQQNMTPNPTDWTSIPGMMQRPHNGNSPFPELPPPTRWAGATSIMETQAPTGGQHPCQRLGQQMPVLGAGRLHPHFQTRVAAQPHDRTTSPIGMMGRQPRQNQFALPANSQTLPANVMIDRQTAQQQGVKRSADDSGDAPRAFKKQTVKGKDRASDATSPQMPQRNVSTPTSGHCPSPSSIHMPSPAPAQLRAGSINPNMTQKNTPSPASLPTYYSPNALGPTPAELRARSAQQQHQQQQMAETNPPTARRTASSFASTPTSTPAQMKTRLAQQQREQANQKEIERRAKQMQQQEAHAKEMAEGRVRHLKQQRVQEKEAADRRAKQLQQALEARQAEERRARQQEDAERARVAQEERLEVERQRVRKEQLRKDPSALYRYYNEYLQFFPLERGEYRSQYHHNLLANRRMPEERTSDLAMAISYAHDHWQAYYQFPRDVAECAKLQREKLTKEGKN